MEAAPAASVSLLTDLAAADLGPDAVILLTQ